MLTVRTQIILIGQLVRKLLNREKTNIVITMTYGRKYMDWQYLNMRSIYKS
jgi:hypothetical protein